MIQYWKAPHILKGLLSRVPRLQAWRNRRAITGASHSPRYCYDVWLRHLSILNGYGFNIKRACIAELGPGDSIGTGLAAVLSGADRYFGLDAIPYSANVNLDEMLSELVPMFSSRDPIHGDGGFPFPNEAIDWANFNNSIQKIRNALKIGVSHSDLVTCQAPWTPAVIAGGALDLVFSEGVLQSIDALSETYETMFTWLKPRGYCSHAIAFNAQYLSPFWNGHWAYSDWQWRLVRGRRPFLHNRAPLSVHISLAEKAGFDILFVRKRCYGDGLHVSQLAPRFRKLSAEDLRTSRATLILRKPG